MAGSQDEERVLPMLEDSMSTADSSSVECAIPVNTPSHGGECDA